MRFVLIFGGLQWHTNSFYQAIARAICRAILFGWRLLNWKFECVSLSKWTLNTQHILIKAMRNYCFDGTISTNCAFLWFSTTYNFFFFLMRKFWPIVKTENATYKMGGARTYRDIGTVLPSVELLCIWPNWEHLGDTSRQFFDSVMIPRYLWCHGSGKPGVEKKRRKNRSIILNSMKIPKV